MIAMDQYGTVVRIAGKHPRKELLDALGYRHAEKVYVDTLAGTTRHVGYVVGGRWFSFFERVTLSEGGPQ